MSELRFENLVLSQVVEDGYDLFVSALGYESRATELSARLAGNGKRRVAIGFDHNKKVAYYSNKGWYENNGVHTYDDVSDEQFVEILREEVHRSIDCASDLNRPKRIAVDVSCINRFRIASVIAAAYPLICEGKIILDIWYALAKYQSPQIAFEQNEVVGPVHSHFGGLFLDPSRPLALLAGLGYEQGKVMGATEFLQASRVVAFFPVSPQKDYEPHVRNANRSLLSELDPRDVIEYPVNDPVRTLATLDSAIRGLEETYNVVILPLGPKLFTVLALFSQLFHDDSSVWRVSSGRRTEPRDAKASGHFFGLGIRQD